MRVLLTGGSSFTGSRFARALVDVGAEVHLAVTSSLSSYPETRAERLRVPGVVLHEGVRHGDGGIAALLTELRVDVLCHHAHPMSGFRDAAYDHVAAVAEMTAFLPAELDAVAASAGRVVYTGTVYEPQPDRPAVSAYGISKATVWEHLRMGAAERDVPVTRFVIPNPFGAGEEGRFGNYLASTWARGETPVVRTPDYIRDNIPVGELTARYLGAVAEPVSEVRPSGYIESQLEFARRVAREVGGRIGRELRVDALEGAPHPEPARVVNDGSHTDGFARNESRYWDEYAAWMATQMEAV